MKKSLFIAALGLGAVTATSSYAQGYVAFSSYVADGALGASTSFSFFKTGLVGAGYTADLYCALGTVSDPVNNSSFISIISPPTGLTDLGVFAAYDNSGAATGADGLGYFNGPTVTMPGYTGGSVTFEVVAFQTSLGYANSIFRGRSGAFTMDDITTSPSNPVTFFGDNGQPMPNFFVVGMPEPSTLVLAGFGRSGFTRGVPPQAVIIG
jgi:hypothetical protein